MSRIHFTFYLDIRYQYPGTDNTEKVIKSVINSEHAIVLYRIREEMQNDRQLQILYKRILKEDWEKHRTDKSINQLYSLKEVICCRW